MNTTVSSLQHRYALFQRKRFLLYSWVAAQLETGKQQGTVAVLDGVRAFACLTVLAYHLNLMTRATHLWTSDEIPLTSAVLLAGSSGVTLFFVLSGFLLFLPYVKALLFKQPWPGTRLFYLRRALRIIPGYYASLFLIVILEKPDYLQPQHWRELVLFPLFLMDSTQATFQRLNGPYWTLAIEWQFYLLLPWIALLIRCVAQRIRAERRVWAVVGCLLGMIVWGVGTRFLGDYLMAHPAATFLVPRGTLNVILFFTYGFRGKYLEDFAVGMLAGLCYMVVRHPATRARCAERLRQLSPWLWGSGILLLLFMAMRIYRYPWPGPAQLFQAGGWLNELGFSLGFGCCVLAILFDSARLNRFFGWMPLRGIGLISYSLYIWHLPLLISFENYIGPSLGSMPAALAYSLYWLWVVVIIIPFSFALYLLVEKPGMRLSDRLRNRIVLQRRKKYPVALPPVDSSDLPERVPVLV